MVVVLIIAFAAGAFVVVFAAGAFVVVVIIIAFAAGAIIVVVIVIDDNAVVISGGVCCCCMLLSSTTFEFVDTSEISYQLPCTAALNLSTSSGTADRDIHASKCIQVAEFRNQTVLLGTRCHSRLLAVCQDQVAFYKYLPMTSFRY